MYKRLSLSLLLVLLCARMAHAQLPVIDVANLVQTSITAVQTVLIVINQLLELAGLDSIMIADTFADDISDLTAIATEGAALMGDISSLQGEISGLLDLASAPSTSTELAQRMSDIRQLVFRVRSYALRTQALIHTLTNTARHLDGLVTAIGDYVGGMQGRQSIMQNLAELNKAQSVLATQSAAYQRADLLDKMEDPLLLESWMLIKQHIMSGY
jgi:hypothetical protein